MGFFIRGGRNGMGFFVRSGKNGMGCFVRGDKNCTRCFVPGGKSMRDVLFRVSKNGMGCFVPGCFVLHSIFEHWKRRRVGIYRVLSEPSLLPYTKYGNPQVRIQVTYSTCSSLRQPSIFFLFFFHY